MLILGLNAYHGDSAACVVKDGQLIAAAEEERFKRIKHWAGFPEQAIHYCLQEALADISDVDYVAVNRNPRANLSHKLLFLLKKSPDWVFGHHEGKNSFGSLVKDRWKNALCIRGLQDSLSSAFGEKGCKARIVYVEHHLAHLASSFFLSGMEQAALCTVDGFGDFVSTMTAVGKGNRIDVLSRVYFPHSLGLFYLAITQYLGFPKYGDEYKVMGLASYGKPAFLEQMRQLVRIKADGRFTLADEYFSREIRMVWEGGEPIMGAVYTPQLLELMGPARNKGEEITARYEDIATSLQTMYEEAFFTILRSLEKRTAQENLCLAGGCAMNSVANGKIFANTGFRDVFIQPAAGDAGGAIGAAYYVYNQMLKRPRVNKMEHAYLGPGYSEEQLAEAIAAHQALQQGLQNNTYSVYLPADEQELLQRTVAAIIDGQVVGCFQGRMEWGPRALGNRSILVDPRRADIKDILNERIKRRESFRPFAPVIIREAVAEYFDTDYEVPFMLMVFKIKPEKRALLPAITHIDGTGRLQTVTEAQNPFYYRLIKRFGKATGMPVLLNTSFNESEPIVNSPQEALDCFVRNNMDYLVMGKTIVQRKQT